MFNHKDQLPSAAVLYTVPTKVPFLVTVRKLSEVREGMTIEHLDGMPAEVTEHRIFKDAHGYAYGMSFDGDRVPYAGRPDEAVTVLTAVPKVGDGATMHIGSDRYPYTVVNVTPNGRRITLRACTAERTDDGGYYTENQTWKIEEDENGATKVATWNPKRGRFLVSGTPVSVGYRARHNDPHV